MSTKYKVLAKSFINEKIVEEGEVVELPEGVEPGKYLEKVTAKEAKELTENKE
jgi:hypothetical protein